MVPLFALAGILVLAFFFMIVRASSTPQPEPGTTSALRTRIAAAVQTPTPTRVPAGTAPAKAPGVTPTAGPKPAAAAAAPAPTRSLEPIKLGFTNSFSGPMAPMGLPERDAIIMLEEKINKEGGINSRPLKLIAYDDESDETKGVLAVKKLIELDKVHALIGTAASGIGMAQAPLVEYMKVPWITMQSAKSTIMPNKKWIFKLPLSEGVYIEGIYIWLKGENITKLAFINQGAGFGREARKYVEETAPKQGFTIVVKEEYGPTDTDIKPQLTKVKASDAQVLVIYGAEAAGAIAVRQAKEMGITIPIIGPESLTLPAIMGNKELRDGLEGLFILGHKADIWEQLPVNDIQLPVLKGLSDQLKAKYGANRVLSMWEGVAHDAFYTMMKAIKEANPDTSKLEESRSKTRDAVEQSKGFLGATSELNYSAGDHEGGLDIKAVVVSRVVGGKLRLIKSLGM